MLKNILFGRRKKKGKKEENFWGKLHFHKEQDLKIDLKAKPDKKQHSEEGRFLPHYHWNFNRMFAITFQNRKPIHSQKTKKQENNT